VLVVSGSSRPDGQLVRVVRHALACVESTGAPTRLLDLAAHPLPLMEFGNAEQARLPAVIDVRRSAEWADGFVLATPEYHGNMSGALKNWFDFLWEELAGKFAGVVAVTGGGGGDMSITAVKRCVEWCHGFTLPFHAAARPEDFDAAGELVGERVRDRLERIAGDVVRYASVTGPAFRRAQLEGPGAEAGFAGLHPPRAPLDARELGPQGDLLSAVAPASAVVLPDGLLPLVTGAGRGGTDGAPP
jgi:FMN reductase